MSCKYCRGEKQLTDKIYEDGTRFDDSQGNHIEYYGKMPMLVSYIRPEYFRIQKEITESITDEQIELLCCSWAVDINF